MARRRRTRNDDGDLDPRTLHESGDGPGRHFARDAVQAFLDLDYPHCPPAIRRSVADAVSRRTWAPHARLAQAAGIVLRNFARHQFTDYDDLLEYHGLAKDEARLVVEDEMRDVLAGWRRGRPD